MNDSEIWNELGSIYLRMGAVDEAIAAFNRAIEIDDQFGWPYNNLACAFCSKGDFSEAIPLYQKSIALLRNDTEKKIAWIRLGDAYYHSNNRDQAIAAYKKAYQLNAKSAPIRIPTNEFQAALHQARNIETSQPRYVEGDTLPLAVQWDGEQDAPIWLVGANSSSADVLQPTCQEDRINKDAIPLWKKNPIAKLEEKQNLSMAQDLKKLSRFMLLVKGIVPPEEALETNTEASEIMTNDQAFRGGKVPVPQAKLSDSVPPETAAGPIPSDAPKVNSNDHISEKNKPAQSILHEGDLENGIAYLKSITARTPANDKAWDALGNLLRAQGNYEDAISSFEQAISLYPEKEEYHYHLGLVYAAQKRHDDAIKEFQRVIQLNPEYVLARGALAGNLRRLGREDEAMEQIKYILPMMQNEKEYNRACFEAICGNTDQALEFLRIALERKQTPLDWVRCDPDLDFIRDDPRFKALLNHEI